MDEFIKKIILRNTINAAFQHGKVYANNLSSNDKKTLKDAIKTKLEELSKNYFNDVTVAQHIENIRNLAQTISQNHRDKLKGHRLRIGTAQKMLNLYVKFLWCLNEIEEPVHCPIDSIVLKKINFNRNWTDLDSIDDYKEIILKIREHLQENETIANWEKEIWNQIA